MAKSIFDLKNTGFTIKMAKSMNKELSRAEYACRKMRKIITQKDEEIDDLKSDVNDLSYELNIYRNIEPIYYPAIVVCSVAGVCISVWLHHSC